MVRVRHRFVACDNPGLAPGFGDDAAPVKLTKKQKKLLREFETACEGCGTHPESEGFLAKIKEFWGSGETRGTSSASRRRSVFSETPMSGARSNRPEIE